MQLVHIKLFPALLTLSLLWVAFAPASAQVYKWIDENGRTHYGERPPQGRKAQEVDQRLANPGPAPAKAAEPDWKAKDLEFRGRRIEAEQAEARQKQQETANRQACNRARDHLAQMKTARGLYRLNDQGERVYASEEERRASMAQLEAQIAQHCR